MKRSIVVLVVGLIAFGAVAARAQVVESATGRRLRVYAGGEGSAFQPDFAYAGNSSGQLIASASPNLLYGVGAYVDADFSRWVQIEAEGRWLTWNQYANISQTTYLVGPRIPIVEYNRFTPYGKFLIGMGKGSFLTANTTVFAYGGGLDYRLSRHFVLRAFDFEYQSWRVSPTLSPYGGSVGLSYRVF